MSSLNRSRGGGSDSSLATPKMPRRPIVVDLDDMQELSTRDLRVSMSSRVVHRRERCRGKPAPLPEPASRLVPNLLYTFPRLLRASRLTTSPQSIKQR